jgi:protein O-GlcNAc transferase
MTIHHSGCDEMQCKTGHPRHKSGRGERLAMRRLRRVVGHASQPTTGCGCEWDFATGIALQPDPGWHNFRGRDPRSGGCCGIRRLPVHIEQIYTQALTEHEDNLFRQALDHHRAGHLAEASGLYQGILQATPDHTDALYLLGVIAHQTGQPAQAVELIRRALAIVPDQARCYNILGLDLMALGMADEAEASFRRAIALEDSPDCYNNLGVLWKEQGRLDDAIAAYQQALARDPGYAAAHYNLGNAARAKGEMGLAAECFRRAVDSDPEHARALAALGQVLQTLARAEDAVPFLKRAIVLMPDDADLHCDLGNALQTLGQLPTANAAYQRSLQLNPKLSRAWYAAGCAESSRKEYVTAVACFRRALEIQPGWPEAQHNLGQVLFKLGQVEAALDLFHQAAAGGDPALPQAAIAVIIPGSPSSDNQSILDARRAWAERQLPPRRTTEHSSRYVRTGDQPLRIGYVSSFFQDHNWMKPVWGLINHHDRRQFEVHLFSDAPASQIQYGYHSHPQDRFHNTTGLSNEALSQRIEHAEIDLLVDLNGYSTMGRLPLFTLRPAPVVVGWFNMYATTGIPSYDYLIGDDLVIPPEEEKFYCERIVRVPGSYLTFEVTYPVPPVVDPPWLTNGAITFGCLASQYKITDEVIGAWSRILRQVPNSSLILKNGALVSPCARQFVHDLFDRQHVSPKRIRLEGPSDHYQFLETYGEIDIALDTFPYNGGTEAIWQGVPVVTFSGDRWVSRTSASILQSAALGELVGQGLEDYISLAISLANSPHGLLNLRRNMRSRLRDSAVCDTQSFARNMERLYTQMFIGVCAPTGSDHSA